MQRMSDARTRSQTSGWHMLSGLTTHYPIYINIATASTLNYSKASVEQRADLRRANQMENSSDSAALSFDVSFVTMLAREDHLSVGERPVRLLIAAD